MSDKCENCGPNCACGVDEKDKEHYRMWIDCPEDPEAWSNLGEFYVDWSVEEVKLFITKLENLASKEEK